MIIRGKIVYRFISSSNKIPAMQIVYESIFVVVNAICYFVRIGPQICLQINMVVIHPGIQYSYNDR